MANVARVTDLDVSVEEMSRHVARFKDQKSTSKSFIDTRIAGDGHDIYSGGADRCGKNDFTIGHTHW